MPTIKYHTKEAAIAAVTKNGNELRFCSTKLQNDEDVVMVAIKQNSWAFEYASAEIKNNKYFIMKALLEVLSTWIVLNFSTINIQSDLEVMTLALEKSGDGWVFSYAQGEVALNKELAAKALVKWGDDNGIEDFDLLDELSPSIKKFFHKNSWYEKAKSYLMQLEYQLEQEKQAELVSGGSTAEDEVVW